MKKFITAAFAAIGLASCASPPELQAAIDGDTAKLRSLLEAGKAEVGTKDLRGMTPLHFAAGNGNLDTAIYLIDAGADVNATDNYGRTPLFLASGIGETKIVELLLDAGANPAIATSELDYWGLRDSSLTALHNAVGNGNSDIVRLLIEAGADVSTPTRNGMTPLSLSQGTKSPLPLAEKSNDVRVAIVELLDAADADRGADFDLVLADAEREEAARDAYRNPNLTLAQRNDAIECGDAELVNMSADQAKAISHLLARKNHPGEKFCIERLEGVDSFELRGDTIIEYIVTVSFPIGYHSNCLGYEERVERVNRNFNWSDFGNVTSGGCNSFSILASGYYFKGPHKPGTVMRFSGKETI